MLHTYYRGCWHVFSRSFLVRYRPFSSLLIELYIPKYFFAHAASLHQSFLHCAIFPTAASRRSLGRVSVPMWPVTLSGRLLIVFSHCFMRSCALMRFYQPFPAAIPLCEAGYPRVTHPSATQSYKSSYRNIPFYMLRSTCMC